MLRRLTSPRAYLIGAALLLVGAVAPRAAGPRPGPRPGPSPRPGGLEAIPGNFAGMQLTPGGAFFAQLVPLARYCQRRTGLPASITLAQAALEASGLNRAGGWDKLAGPHHNLFGFKAAGKPVGPWWDGSSVEVESNEGPGQNIPVTSRFCAYPHPYHSVMHRAHHFHTSERYAPALLWLDEPLRFLANVVKAGYAGDSAYLQKIWALVERYNLTQHDLRPSDWRLDPAIVGAKTYAYWRGRGAGGA